MSVRTELNTDLEDIAVEDYDIIPEPNGDVTITVYGRQVREKFLFVRKDGWQKRMSVNVRNGLPDRFIRIPESTEYTVAMDPGPPRSVTSYRTFRFNLVAARFEEC